MWPWWELLFLCSSPRLHYAVGTGLTFWDLAMLQTPAIDQKESPLLKKTNSWKYIYHLGWVSRNTFNKYNKDIELIVEIIINNFCISGYIYICPRITSLSSDIFPLWTTKTICGWAHSTVTAFSSLYCTKTWSYEWALPNGILEEMMSVTSRPGSWKPPKSSCPCSLSVFQLDAGQSGSFQSEG